MGDHCVRNLQDRQLIEKIFADKPIAWKFQLVTPAAFADNEFGGELLQHVQQPLHQVGVATKKAP